MKKHLILILLLFFFSSYSHAYESEDKMQAVIIGKLAKFIKWKTESEYFVITVLKNPFNTLLDTLYQSQYIKNQPVKINYIDSINELSDTNILYIPRLNHAMIEQILVKTKNKNILTISNSRGFTDKGGMIQLSFVSQKIKIKINNDLAKSEHLNINPSLLRISTIVKNKVNNDN